MNKETDILKIKQIAKNLLKLPIRPMEFLPMMVNHPFTNTSIISNPRDGGFLNIVQNPADLQSWQKLVEETIDNSRSVEDLYMFVSTTYKFVFFNLISNYLSNKDFSTLLGSAYTGTDNPNEVLNKAQLLNLFKKATPFDLMDNNEFEIFKNLPETITIYRSAKTSKKNNIETLSWTLDYNIAKWFSNRHTTKGRIFQAEINKEHVLAYFNRRNEKEVIIDYHYLTNIKEVTNNPNINLSSDESHL